ncbi:MAG: hypothetical protein EHM47_01515 [Ignavibacteriales bacterium]|nr:MAG: hypothetical protein EHM47_01515 [Ignavibacteriales bacterium]
MKVLFVFVFSILITSVIFAQIPRTISYQGVLTDEFGNPKPDGDYNFIFMLYETSTGGDTIWSESKTLNVSKGLFSTSLGEPTPFGAEVKFDKPYWLGIKVGTDPELSPRIALTSSGYSLTSDNALNIVDGKVVKSLNNLKDNITMEGAGGTTITTNGNTIIISSTGGSGSGIQGVQNTNNTIDIVNPNGPTATINLKVPLSINGVVNMPDYLIVADVTGTGGGIIGTSTNGFGIVGQGLGTSGINYGIAGNSNSPDGFAVSGWNTSTTGDAVGIVGRTNSPDGVGIEGFGGSSGIGVQGLSIGGYGVYGKSDNLVGVYGYCPNNGWGVFGESPSGYGIYGFSNSSRGVYGFSVEGYGVYGRASSDGIGIRAENSTGNYALLGMSSWAGFFSGESYFDGGVYITGDFSVNGTKNFKIDHPLDPTNKYLIHSCVESSERMNIYNGNITTDGNGFALVELPGYFETLNIEYRYQLTVIGQFAQAIIENEISQNRFTIKTDKPNVKVSWQVTGIRNDEYAKQNPFAAEKEKEDFAKGKYLIPELYGQPKEMGINYVKVPEFDQPQFQEN